jgi:hypothetical protein
MEWAPLCPDFLKAFWILKPVPAGNTCSRMDKFIKKEENFGSSFLLIKMILKALLYSEINRDKGPAFY